MDSSPARRRLACWVMAGALMLAALPLAAQSQTQTYPSRPIRLVLCDEVDRYPASAGAEGDPVSLARAAVTAGFTGLGFGRTFLHIDRRARRTAFHYPGGKVAWTQRFGFDPVPAFKASGHLNGA